MKYKTDDINEARQAFDYLTKLMGDHAIVEIKKVSPRRSLNQNNYLHLLLGAFGQHFGYTIEEAKLIYKEINSRIYSYDKKGRRFFKSSADLDTAEMTKTIDKFREKSKAAGYPLPSATDQEWLRQIENEIERASYYL